MTSFLSKKKLKIVFWDDEVETGKRLLFTEIKDGFEIYGWTPYIFTDKEEAKKVALNDDIDAVVLDVIENGKPVGLDILTYLREKRPFLPIVMFTIHDDIKYIQGAMKGDVSYFLTMPIKSYHDVIKAIEVAVEKEKAKERLVQDRYFASIGELAGGVAHFIKNSLWNIGSRTQTLLEKTNKKDESYKLLETIKRRSDEANKVVVGLLNFARRRNQKPEWKEVNIIELINDVLKLLSYELEYYKITVKMKVLSKKIKILGDEFELKEAFLNIIKNAIEAMPDSGNLSIEVKSKEKDVIISFSDTGTGMNEETLENIFIPFYTTKSESVGFGLFETQKIIKAHGGTVDVKSDLGKGSTFFVALPYKLKS